MSRKLAEKHKLAKYLCSPVLCGVAAAVVCFWLQTVIAFVEDKLYIPLSYLERFCPEVFKHLKS